MLLGMKKSLKTNGILGRERETTILREIRDKKNNPKAQMLIVYGRRRVGKTTLIEEVFNDRKLIKIEGIENEPESAQIQSAIKQFHRSSLAKNIPANTLDLNILSKGINDWDSFLSYISGYLKKGKHTLYFEEYQWLSNYDTKLTSYFKYYWDNYLQHNKDLVVIFCGSSPSFMIHAVLRSKALYNRSQQELKIKPFELNDAVKFFKKTISLKEIMDGYLLVGGIPPYLKEINKSSSVLLSLANASFTTSGFFVDEVERLYVSAMAKSPHYRQIIEFLSKRKFATRAEILKHLNVSSGGGISKVFIDLEECDFIEKVSPLYLNNGKNLTKLEKYCIKDSFLNFYYTFINQKVKKIKRGDYEKNPLQGLDTKSLEINLGFAFERFCRFNAKLIAEKLGFGSVEYEDGPIYQKSSSGNGYQLDLVYKRKDRVLTVCEIKYNSLPLGMDVCEEFDKKINLFLKDLKSNPSSRISIHKVLITANGVKDTVKNSFLFDNILRLEDLL